MKTKKEKLELLLSKIIDVRWEVVNISASEAIRGDETTERVLSLVITDNLDNAIKNMKYKIN